MSSSPPVAAGGFSRLADAYAWLDGRIDFERRLDRLAYDDRTFALEDFRRRLAGLGNPHQGRPAIHIAGTRGKGSSALMLEALLMASGLRVATFTSPHLNEYRERIRIDGRPIGPEAFCRALGQAAALGNADATEPGSFRTVFESLTAAFFVAAREAQVDWLVVETGLGGRLDATNVLDPGPVLLTRIGLEHTRLLGGTIPLIAREKAAILKPSGWGVVAPQGLDGGARQVFAARSAETGAPLRDAEALTPLQSARFDPSGTNLVLTFEGEPLEFTLPWFGPFLVENLQGALSVLSWLRRCGRVPLVPRAALGEAMAALELPARMQRVAALAEGVLEGYVDGGHCPTAAGALARTMETHFGEAGAVALVGMMNDKDHRAFFGELSAWRGWRRVYCYAPAFPRAESPSELAARAREFFPRAEPVADWREALARLLARPPASCRRIVATGTFYEAGPIIRWMRDHA